MVQDRAKLLGATHCYVGRESKLDILMTWINDLKINISEIAFIGDDINDLAVMSNVGVAVCPINAVNRIKSVSHIILSKKGGDGCVREFIDQYLLQEPI